MKKLVLSAVLGASLMISSSAFALTAMSDANMKAATGQAGVSIAIDNVVIEQYAGSTSYIDTDTGAAVVISDKHVVKTMLAMTSEADYQADFLAQAGVANLGTWDEAHALSIDVGRCSALSAGIESNMGAPAGAVTIAGVVIGLPTLLINTTADSYNVGVTMTGAANSGANFIRVSKGASTMAILGGTVEIAPH